MRLPAAAHRPGALRRSDPAQRPGAATRGAGGHVCVQVVVRECVIREGFIQSRTRHVLVCTGRGGVSALDIPCLEHPDSPRVDQHVEIQRWP